MPLQNAIERSPLNPISFVQQDFAKNPSNGLILDGQDWEANTILKGIPKEVYYYPAEIADLICLQFSVTMAGLYSVELEIIRPIKRPNGTFADVIFTYSFPLTNLLTGNQITVDGVSYMAINYTFNASFADVPNLKEGTYYFRLKVSSTINGSAVPNAFHYNLSEPINVRLKHPQTIRINATNFTNDYNTIFVQTGAVFSCRMLGALHNYEPSSIDTTYINQRGKVRKLYGQPLDTKVLTVGGGNGLTQWVKAWVNSALTCDKITVGATFDEITINKDSSSKFEQISNSGYPLGGMSMVIQADSNLRYLSVIRKSVNIFVEPAFPYYIYGVSINNGSITKDITTVGYYVGSEGDRDTFLRRVSVGIAKLRLLGFAGFARDMFNYYNGIGETYTVNYSILLPYALYFDSNSGTVAITTNANEIAIRFEQYKTERLNSGSQTTSYTYPSGTHSTAILHNNNAASIETSSANITGIRGKIPTNNTALNITSGLISTFDFNLLIPAKAVFAHLDLHNNKISSLQNIRSLYFGSPSVPMWLALIYVDLSGNNLSSADVNEMLLSILTIYNSVGLIGTLKLQGQTPAAAPTGAGITDKASLILAGWTVTTD